MDGRRSRTVNQIRTTEKIFNNDSTHRNIVGILGKVNYMPFIVNNNNLRVIFHIVVQNRLIRMDTVKYLPVFP